RSSWPTLLEMVRREDGAVGSGAHRLRALQRLEAFVAAPRTGEREAQVVGRRDAERLVGERRPEVFDRLVVALLLQVELSEVDLRTDVVRVPLQDTVERAARLILASSARTRGEAEDVQRVSVLRQEARGFGRFALS